MPVINFSGLGSGLDTSTWVEALVKAKKESAIDPLTKKQETLNKSQSSLSALQSTFNSLRSAMEKLTDSKYGGTFDVFSKTKATSSEDSIVTATSSANAARGSYKISVQQLASATTAESATGALAVKGSSLFSSISDSTGSFSVYVNGEKNTINVDEGATVDDVLSQINNIDGVNASIKDGKVNITGDSGNSVVVGSSTDSVNISKAFSLRKGTDGNYQSFETLSTVNSSSKIVDALGDSAKGTFKIGNAEFTIDENTTFDSLSKAVNENKDAGVTASFDKTNGQFVFTSTNNGSFNINIEKGSSQFTDLMGYTSTDSVTGATKLADQNLGQFAIFSINGETKMSSSNSISSEVSGIKGVTFNLKGVSTDEKKSSTVDVKQDTDDLVSAVKDFVEKYNEAIEKVDTETASDGSLYGESNLISLRNNLRTTATAKDDGASTFKILASIGISTGKTTTDVTKVSNKLEFDEEKFIKAFEEDPEAVKSLLIGGKDNEGVISKLKGTVDSSLNTDGYFTTRHNSLDRQATTLTKKIETENTRLDEYKARLEKEFQNMEKMIASFQKSYSSLLSGLSQK